MVAGDAKPGGGGGGDAPASKPGAGAGGTDGAGGAPGKDGLACDVCNVRVGNAADMAMHMGGKKHAKNLRANAARARQSAAKTPVVSQPDQPPSAPAEKAAVDAPVAAPAAEEPPADPEASNTVDASPAPSVPGDAEGTQPAMGGLESGAANPPSNSAAENATPKGAEAPVSEVDGAHNPVVEATPEASDGDALLQASATTASGVAAGATASTESAPEHEETQENTGAVATAPGGEATLKPAMNAPESSDSAPMSSSSPAENDETLALSTTGTTVSGDVQPMASNPEATKVSDGAEFGKSRGDPAVQPAGDSEMKDIPSAMPTGASGVFGNASSNQELPNASLTDSAGASASSPAANIAGSGSSIGQSAAFPWRPFGASASSGAFPSASSSAALEAPASLGSVGTSSAIFGSGPPSFGGSGGAFGSATPPSFGTSAASKALPAAAVTNAGLQGAHSASEHQSSPAVVGESAPASSSGASAMPFGSTAVPFGSGFGQTGGATTGTFGLPVLASFGSGPVSRPVSFSTPQSFTKPKLNPTASVFMPMGTFGLQVSKNSGASDFSRPAVSPPGPAAPNSAAALPVQATQLDQKAISSHGQAQSPAVPMNVDAEPGGGPDAPPVSSMSRDTTAAPEISVQKSADTAAPGEVSDRVLMDSGASSEMKAAEAVAGTPAKATAGAEDRKASDGLAAPREDSSQVESGLSKVVQSSPGVPTTSGSPANTGKQQSMPAPSSVKSADDVKSSLTPDLSSAASARTPTESELFSRTGVTVLGSVTVPEGGKPMMRRRPIPSTVRVVLRAHEGAGVELRDNNASEAWIFLPCGPDVLRVARLRKKPVSVIATRLGTAVPGNPTNNDPSKIAMNFQKEEDVLEFLQAFAKAEASLKPSGGIEGPSTPNLGSSSGSASQKTSGVPGSARKSGKAPSAPASVSGASKLTRDEDLKAKKLAALQSLRKKRKPAPKATDTPPTPVTGASPTVKSPVAKLSPAIPAGTSLSANVAQSSTNPKCNSAESLVKSGEGQQRTVSEPVVPSQPTAPSAMPSAEGLTSLGQHSSSGGFISDSKPPDMTASVPVKAHTSEAAVSSGIDEAAKQNAVASRVPSVSGSAMDIDKTSGGKESAAVQPTIVAPKSDSPTAMVDVGSRSALSSGPAPEDGGPIGSAADTTVLPPSAGHNVGIGTQSASGALATEIGSNSKHSAVDSRPANGEGSIGLSGGSLTHTAAAAFQQSASQQPSGSDRSISLNPSTEIAADTPFLSSGSKRSAPESVEKSGSKPEKKVKFALNLVTAPGQQARVGAENVAAQSGKVSAAAPAVNSNVFGLRSRVPAEPVAFVEKGDDVRAPPASSASQSPSSVSKITPVEQQANFAPSAAWEEERKQLLEQASEAAKLRVESASLKESLSSAKAQLLAAQKLQEITEGKASAKDVEYKEKSSVVEKELQDAIKDSKQIRDRFNSWSVSRRDVRMKMRMECRPANVEDFFERLDSFTPSTWYGYNESGRIDPVECAMHGWFNTGHNVLMSTEGAIISFDAECGIAGGEESYEAEVSRVRDAILATGHKMLSQWTGSSCPEEFRGLGHRRRSPQSLQENASIIRRCGISGLLSDAELASGLALSENGGGESDEALCLAARCWKVISLPASGRGLLACGWCQAHCPLPEGSSGDDGAANSRDRQPAHYAFCPMNAADSWKEHVPVTMDVDS